MKYTVTRFKSMQVALKDMEPFIRNGLHLQSGRAFAQFDGMRSREILANWLLCATLNATDSRRLSFSSDPTGGDGIILDGETETTWQTEHIMVPRHPAQGKADAHELVLAAIEHKRKKGGAAYAEGKTLVVFLDADAGEWFPNRVARRLPEPLYFDAVWVVGLQKVEDGAYSYGLTLLDISSGDAPTYIVTINKTFDAWDVTCIQ